MKRFFLLLALFLLLASGSFAEYNWWNSSWQYNQKIDLDTSSYLAGAVVADHVIPIDINSSNTIFWENVDSSGKDVRFLNSTQTTIYDFYFEKFDYANKDAVALVEVTETFSNTSNLSLQ